VQLGTVARAAPAVCLSLVRPWDPSRDPNAPLSLCMRRELLSSSACALCL